MNRLVVDNSVSAAWCFTDEANQYTEAVLQDIADFGGAVVPALWPVEVANSLIVAERRNRITAEKRMKFLDDLTELDIQVEPAVTARIFTTVIRLAETYQLSAYDAMYLELALREGLALATQDKQLIAAARASGVSVWSGTT